MSKHILRSTSFALAAAVLALVLPGTADAQDEDVSTVIYAIRNVSLNSAWTLAESICGEAFRVAIQSRAPDEIICNVSRLSSERSLAVSASAELHGRISQMLSGFDRMPETKAFHIIVLSAGTTSTTQDLDIPDGARRALADFAEFMPYSSFEVLASGLMRTSSQAQTTLPGPVEFRVGLVFRRVSDPQTPILIETFEISQMTPPVYDSAGGIVTESRFRQVLETTFTIEPGETVVVGTSKLAGDDDAVVVLLTAIQN